MKMTAMPSAFRRRMTSSSFSVSAIGRLEVGSSRMTSRALKESALAISTSWRCASESPKQAYPAENLAPSAAQERPRRHRVQRSGPPG